MDGADDADEEAASADDNDEGATGADDETGGSVASNGSAGGTATPDDHSLPDEQTDDEATHDEPDVTPDTDERSGSDDSSDPGDVTSGDVNGSQPGTDAGVTESMGPDVDGGVPSTLGCTVGGSECGVGEFCRSNSGVCTDDELGQCEPVPNACDGDYTPVCGCDGNTYGNACGADSAGVNQRHAGECQVVEGGDGSSCTVDGMVYPDGAGDIPSEDGCNTCFCSDGALGCTKRACLSPNEGAACGARAGDTCSKDEYCAYMPGQYCGAADAQATCQPRPDNCLDQYDPVCGCDENTYGNACEANAAGVGVLSEGQCESAASL